MTNYTISCKLSNETVYAYYRGRFWHWNGSIWKESRIMTHRFELAKAADKKLTPPEFLSNGAEFAPLDEYEIDSAMLDALENAKPCKNAPIEPVKEDPTCKTAPNADAAAITAERAAPNATAEMQATSESAEGASASIPAVSPQTCESAPGASVDDSFPATSAAMESTPAAFDFSALGDLSGQAAEADHQFDLHYGTAQDEYLISCIYLARVHALTAKAGRYGGGTWTKWYESKGMSKSSVWNMLQTGEGFKGSTIEQLTSIPELSRKDLNLIARSGCAEQLTAAAGDSQRVQELLAQLKAEKSRADTAEAHLEAAHADINGLTERAQKAESERDKARADQLSTAKDCNRLGLKVSQEKDRADKAEAREEEAWKLQSKAEARAKDAESQLSGSRQVAEAAKLRADKLKAENDALKKQPITAVVDQDEVQRQADALAAKAKAQASKQIEDAQRRAREAEARYQKLQQDADGFLAPEQSCAQQAKIIADSMRSMYLGWFGLASNTGTPLARMAAPIYQVCDEIRESLEEDTTINPTAAGSEEDAEREALFE